MVVSGHIYQVEMVLSIEWKWSIKDLHVSVPASPFMANAGTSMMLEENSHAIIIHFIDNHNHYKHTQGENKNE